MEWLIPVGVIAYLMIGVFIGTFLARDVGNNEPETLAVLLWPVVLFFFLMIFVSTIPYRLANWIMDRKK